MHVVGYDAHTLSSIIADLRVAFDNPMTRHDVVNEANALAEAGFELGDLLRGINDVLRQEAA